MIACDRIAEGFLLLGTLPLGLSWLYCLYAIISDVNKMLPAAQQLDPRSAWTGKAPWRVHQAWNEHVRLFPRSRMRLCAAFSLLAAFLSGIIPFAACLLFAGAAK